MQRLLVFAGFLSVATSQGPLEAPFVPAFNNNPLASEGYSEGSCIVPDVVTNTDVNWLSTQGTFYVPIASQFSHRRHAETFLSRPPTSESEVQSMCLTVEISATQTGLNISNFGYDNRNFRQSCSLISPGRFSCLALGGSSGVNPSKTSITEDHIVSIDNRSYLLIVRCVDGYFRDYKLLTTRPTVSLELYNTVLNVTRNLGFDDRRLQILSYDSCLNNVELNTANPTRSIQRRTTLVGFSPYAAPFAPNPVTFGQGQNPFNFGVGQNNINPGLSGLGQNQNNFRLLGQDTGNPGLGQNPNNFGLNGQNPGAFGINPNINPLAPNGPPFSDITGFQPPPLQFNFSK